MRTALRTCRALQGRAPASSWGSGAAGSPLGTTERSSASLLLLAGHPQLGEAAPSGCPTRQPAWPNPAFSLWSASQNVEEEETPTCSRQGTKFADTHNDKDSYHSATGATRTRLQPTGGTSKQLGKHAKRCLGVSGSPHLGQVRRVARRCRRALEQECCWGAVLPPAGTD